MLQQAWETVIVFRGYDDQAVGALDRGAELAVLERFAGVIHPNGNFPDVDQFRCDIASFRCFTKNEICGGFR
jgi:hypothetical protein